MSCQWSKMPRPRLYRLFVASARLLEVGFYTSSVEKFLQARLVLQQYGLVLRHFRSSQEPYEEDYSLGQHDLLARAIEQIKRRLGVNTLFFVEDTSVRIEALSEADKDFPGLAIKEWFAQTSFDECDAALRRMGNNRTVRVNSDIALHVPGLDRAVLIHGETIGRIAESPPDFARSIQYPWLTPDTFNGWFIPEVANKRLGEMSFEESLDYDFRVRALAGLVDRLEEYAAILNLDGKSYSIKRSAEPQGSIGLFKRRSPIYIILGRVCAGKTTLGQYGSTKHSYQFIEASSIVRMIAEEEKLTAPSPLYLARDLLQLKGPDIVARQIVAAYGDGLTDGAIITGFRTIEELQYIRKSYSECTVIFVDASIRTRFERHLQRGRPGSIQSIDDFREHERQQGTFGLLPVAQDLCDIRVENEGTIEQYYSQIDALFTSETAEARDVSETRDRPGRLQSTRLFRCLRALEGLPSPALCGDIAAMTDRDTPSGNPDHVERISPRHVNWVLKDFPELARRVDVRGDRIRYEILPPGRAYLAAVRSLSE